MYVLCIFIIQISVLCYLYALYFNSLYACTVHVAELTIKQTLTLTNVYINIHTYSIYLGKYFQNIYCICVYLYIYIYIINIHSTYTYYVN